MADDFQGVPRDEWHSLIRSVNSLQWISIFVLVVLAALIAVLKAKGIISAGSLLSFGSSGD